MSNLAIHSDRALETRVYRHGTERLHCDVGQTGRRRPALQLAIGGDRATATQDAHPELQI